MAGNDGNSGALSATRDNLETAIYVALDNFAIELSGCAAQVDVLALFAQGGGIESSNARSVTRTLFDLHDRMRTLCKQISDAQDRLASSKIPPEARVPHG